MKLNGFTLVEALLYTSIVSVIIVVYALFFSSIVRLQQSNRTVFETDQAANHAIEHISYLLRNATSVSAPTYGATSTSLTFVSPSALSNPVTIQISSGKITITEGATGAVALTTNQVTATNLTFINLANTGEKASIKFSFDLTYINPDNRPESDYSKTYYGSATLR